MSKRILTGLLVVSMLLMGAPDANAFNRILGIVLRHSDLTVDVFLRGAPPSQDTTLTVSATILVEIICRNPKDKLVGPGTPEQQVVDATQDKIITSDLFDPQTGEALVSFVFVLDDLRCHQRNYRMVPGSALALNVSADTSWTNKKNQTIEALATTCVNVLGRDSDGNVISGELGCESEVVSH